MLKEKLRRICAGNEEGEDDKNYIEGVVDVPEAPENVRNSLRFYSMTIDNFSVEMQSSSIFGFHWTRIPNEYRLSRSRKYRIGFEIGIIGWIQSKIYEVL